MRRPKDPNDPASGGGDDKSPPGGRARERLDQFNRQRRSPDDSPASKEDDAGETQRPAPREKPNAP